MALIEVPETRYKGVRLPGGWETRVPEITVNGSDPRVKDIVTMLCQHGMRRPEAEVRALEVCEKFWRREWRARIMKTVGRWAKVYADQNYGSLQGFDPETVARLWIPGAFGGRFGQGNKEMKALFVEMRRGQQEAGDG